MSKESLFSPLQLGALQLPNRIIMAPLTRMRAGANSVPTALNAKYYAQRSSAGLIISEGTAVSPDAHGYPSDPGIYTAEQIAGWRVVTDAVHARGGTDRHADRSQRTKLAFFIAAGWFCARRPLGHCWEHSCPHKRLSTGQG